MGNSVKKAKRNTTRKIGNSLPEAVITPDEEYNYYLNTLPDNQRLAPSSEYDSYLYWKLNGQPRDFQEGINRGMFHYNDYDKSYHANSIAWGDDGVGYFMKPKTHPTVHMETDRFNKGLIYEDNGIIRQETPEEKAQFDSFRNSYDLIEDPNRPNYYRYQPKEYSEGGSLKTYKQWGELSIKEKSDMMKVAVRNGITNLADIKAKYNEFAEGGNIYSGTKTGSQQMKQMASAGSYVYDIIPRLLAQDGVHVMVSSGYRPGSMTKSGNKSRHSTHEAADIIPIKGSSFADINRVINDPNSVTSRWMLANGYGYIDETSATGTTKYWHDYKKDHSHYHIGRDSSYAKQYASRMGGMSRGEYTQPVAIPQQTYIPQETIAFEPSNPEAFFAPLGTYNTPVAEREIEQPLVEAANEYSEEALKRAEQRQGLNNFLTVLSLTNPNNSSDDFFSGVTSMLTGSPLTNLANLSAEGGHLYPDGGDKSWYIPQSQVSVDPRTGNTYNPNTGTYNGVLVPAEVVVTPQSQTAMSGLEVAKELSDNQYRTMPTNSEANAYADWWTERTAPGIGDFVGATLKPLDLITPSRYVGLMDSDNNRGFLHLFDANNRGLFINNDPQGFFSKKYAEEHPLLAMAGNTAFDIPASIGAGWAIGKGLNANKVHNVKNISHNKLNKAEQLQNELHEKASELVQKGLKEAKEYKESSGYKGLVQSFINETGEPDIPIEAFYNERHSEIPTVIFEDRPRGDLGGFQQSSNTIFLDPKQMWETTPYHEGLHWQRVGNTPFVYYTNPDYNAWSRAFTEGLPKTTQDNLFKKFYSSGNLPTLDKQNAAIKYLYNKKVNDVIKPGTPSNSEMWKPSELAVHNIQAGKELGLKPFQEYPGKEEALKIINEAKKKNSWLKDIKSTTDEDIQNFWKLLTGNYLPVTIAGLATGATAANNIITK